MNINQVNDIMGKPDTILLEPLTGNNYWFVYESKFGTSDNYFVYISVKDSIVVGLNYGD